MRTIPLAPILTSALDRAIALGSARLQLHIATCHEREMAALFPKRFMPRLKTETRRCQVALMELQDRYEEEDYANARYLSDRRQEEYESTHTWLMAARATYGRAMGTEHLSDRALATLLMDRLVKASNARERAWSDMHPDAPSEDARIADGAHLTQMMYATLAALSDDEMHEVLDTNRNLDHDGTRYMLADVKGVREWQARQGTQTIKEWREEEQRLLQGMRHARAH